jgi:hypothetical protein
MGKWGFEQEFKNCHAIFEELSKKAEDLIEQVVMANSYLVEVESEDAATNHQQHNKSFENDYKEETILPFSDITDKNGYNVNFCLQTTSKLSWEVTFVIENH